MGVNNLTDLKQYNNLIQRYTETHNHTRAYTKHSTPFSGGTIRKQFT